LKLQYFSLFNLDKPFFHHHFGDLARPEMIFFAPSYILELLILFFSSFALSFAPNRGGKPGYNSQYPS